jgi:cold shock CspA family protein
MRRSRYFLTYALKKTIAITRIRTVCPTRTLFDRSLQTLFEPVLESRCWRGGFIDLFVRFSAIASDGYNTLQAVDKVEFEIVRRQSVPTSGQCNHVKFVREQFFLAAAAQNWSA